MRRFLILGSLLIQPVAAAEPARLLSLDYCADAYLVALADPEEIAALSPDAAAPFAWAREHAAAHKQHKGGIEDILGAHPTLVIRAGSGHARLDHMLDRFDIETIELGYAESLDDARRAVSLLGERLGRQEKAARLLGDLERRLAAVGRRVAALDQAGRRPSALYLTPSGVTSGGGTYIDEAMRRAGIDNLLAETGVEGFSRLNPESMLTHAPDMMITSFFGSRPGWQADWRFSVHPVTLRAMEQRFRAEIPAGSWGCAGFFLIDAIEALASARAAWQGRNNLLAFEGGR